VESTYGDRLHKSFDQSKEELKEIIKNTIKHGNVLIPSYALERTQDILYVLREFYEEGSLPKCKIFLDSPLAIGVTKVFLRNPEYFRKETYDVMQKEDPFSLPYLTMVRDVEESKQINDIQEGAIIIAGSGMLSGGRILHHIRHHAYKEQNAIVFVGYQPHGTLGRRILEKQNPVFVMGEPINIRAKIYTVNGFSSHADQSELIEWVNAANPEKICLIHGEEDKMLVLKDKLANKNVYIPSRKEVIDV
jgi:metallo-beta-lactamase family protein